MPTRPAVGSNVPLNASVDVTDAVCDHPQCDTGGTRWSGLTHRTYLGDQCPAEGRRSIDDGDADGSQRPEHAVQGLSARGTVPNEESRSTPRGSVFSIGRINHLNRGPAAAVSTNRRNDPTEAQKSEG